MAIETATVTLNLKSISNGAKEGDRVSVVLCNDYARYENTLIKREFLEFCADSNGIVSMSLIETETMTEDTGEDVYYTLQAFENYYSRSFTVPKGSGTIDFFSLPDYSF